MGMGRRQTERQQELWVPTQKMASGPRHVFYDELNRLLAEAEFDPWIEEQCREFYSPIGRDSIPPGTFFRMIFVGFFEGISSHRGIAWRCDDSLSLRKFLGYASHEETPDHSSLSRIRGRLPKEIFDDVFRFILQIVDEHQLLDGRTVGVDSTTLEANAAMKSIVRKDTGEGWEDYVTRLAAAEGIEIKSKADLIRYDKKRNRKQKKKVSNDDWFSPGDPDARIARMKDGTTHLAYKAEHVVDLETGVILAAEVYHANVADSATLTDSLNQAQENLDRADTGKDIEKVAADKGYHKAETLAACEDAGTCGITPYIPEPERKHEHVWTDKPSEHQRATLLNRRRTRRKYGKQLQRRRSEVVERTFAHTCDTGGGRRSWLRGIENVEKRYLLQAAAHNLAVVLRKLLGAGKPRQFAALWALLAAIWVTMERWWHHLGSSLRHTMNLARSSVASTTSVARFRARPGRCLFSTGC